MLSGTPLASGGPFTLTVTDANGCEDSLTFTVLATPPTPCPVITITPSTIPIPVVGVAYSQQLTASGGVAPYQFFVISGSLPPGLTLSDAGLISGTPTSIPPGLVTIRAIDANGCPGEITYAPNGGPTDAVCPPQDGFTAPVTTATNCIAPTFP